MRGFCKFVKGENDPYPKCEVCLESIETDNPDMTRIYRLCRGMPKDQLPNPHLRFRPRQEIPFEIPQTTRSSPEPEYERDRKLPGLVSQFKHLVGDVKDHVLAGCGTLPEEEAKARLEVCNGCPSRVGNRCSECGCFLMIRATWASSHCPLGKWPGDSENRV